MQPRVQVRQNLVDEVQGAAAGQQSAVDLLARVEPVAVVVEVDPGVDRPAATGDGDVEGRLTAISAQELEAKAKEFFPDYWAKYKAGE